MAGLVAAVDFAEAVSVVVVGVCGSGVVSGGPAVASDSTIVS